jgi:CelD/BcsL family acetyltransferase involved in cellulose biosynthesis
MNSINSHFGALAMDAPVSRPFVAAGASTWTFALTRGAAGFAALRGEWQEMLDGLPRASYQQAPAWLSSYLFALAPRPQDICWVAARSGGRLHAVLALESVSHGPAVLGIRSLRLITGDHMVLSDAAGDPLNVGLWPALHAWLERHSGLSWQFLSAPGVCADSCLGRWLSASPQTIPTITCPVAATLWIDCSGDVKHALRDVSRSHQTNVRRLTRRARELGTLTYEVVTEPTELELAFESFLQVEASGWKGEQGSAIRLHPELVNFYRSLMQQFGARGECRINLLRLNGEVIAAQFGLVSGRQLNLLKIGYQEKYSHIAPGHLIMQNTIDSLCADPRLQRLSFVTRPAWAHLWKPESTGVSHHVILRSSVTGRLMRLVLRAWQSRPRPHRPSRAVVVAAAANG